MLAVDLATTADLAELTSQGVALFEEDAGRHDTFVDLSWSQREGRADFERLLATTEAVVLRARIGGAPIGHLVGHTHLASPTRLPVTYANLRSLYVVPEHRRQGAADLLVRTFVEWARARGCAEVHVDTYVRNEPAQRLYERHGFATRSTSRALVL